REGRLLGAVPEVFRVLPRGALRGGIPLSALHPGWIAGQQLARVAAGREGGIAHPRRLDRADSLGALASLQVLEGRGVHPVPLREPHSEVRRLSGGASRFRNATAHPFLRPLGGALRSPLVHGRRSNRRSPRGGELRESFSGYFPSRDL